jgi:hypothetical protein
MTLVVTDIRQSWIAMAAESAVHFDGEIDLVDAYGAKKLFPIYRIGAGISMFGLAQIASKKQTLSKYIEEYVDWAEQNINSIEEFSIELSNRLNKDIGLTDRDLGFQIAGFVDKNKER